MVKILSLQLVCFTLLLSTSIFAGDTKILLPGNVIELDLFPESGKSLNGAEFLALHKVKLDGEYFLTMAIISLAPVPGEVVAVSSNIGNAIAFVRDKKIKSGAVLTATHEHGGTNKQVAGIWLSKSTIQIQLGNRTYSIHETSPGLSLTGSDRKSRVLSDRVGFFIIWAGDMDRDGELDLIVNSEDGDEKNSSSCLLLSSIAKKPELVKLSSCQAYSG